MSQENVEIVRRVYEAYKRGDIDGAGSSCCDPEADGIITDSARWPELGGDRTRGDASCFGQFLRGLGRPSRSGSSETDRSR